VVEPISKVVLVVDENRHVATLLRCTGQWAKSERMLGSPWAPADAAVPVTNSVVAARAAAAATVVRRCIRRAGDR
jgi:hypothetical protein